MTRELPPPVERYLEQLTGTCREVLGGELLGLYLSGSAAQEDYGPGTSDLDVLGVIRSPIAGAVSAKLLGHADHATLPVPALGLELTFLTEESTRDPSGGTGFDWALSTGATWPRILEERGSAAEIPIERALCREHGRALFGPPASEVFAPVPRDVLLRAVRHAVEWQRRQILDPFHDPRGRNSVLNACRARRFAETGDLGSKTEGGRWWLSIEPGNALVETALALRSGRDVPAPDASAIDAFLADVVRRLEGP